MAGMRFPQLTHRPAIGEAIGTVSPRPGALAEKQPFQLSGGAARCSKGARRLAVPRRAGALQCGFA
jgi:hypothetical protein